MTIAEAGSLLRSRKTSAVELVEESLTRIHQRNPELAAFLTVTEDLARSQARQADAELRDGKDRGPLHGIPIALKDVFATKGIRTTCGSKLFANHVPDRDSAVTEKLASAGAVLLGKTGMHELAYGITSNNPHFGTVRNPFDTGRIPGGSSGGSAVAVATDMVFGAMGSDTGGSIRLPASYCGIVGLKPTSGRVSRYGVMPLDFSLDHMGPMTRTVRDAALMLNAIAGPDARDDTCSPRPIEDYSPPGSIFLKGKRIGWPENFYFEVVEDSVRKACESAAERAKDLGAEIVPVRVPDILAMNTVARIILMSEASATFDSFMARRDDFGADVLALLDQGRLLSATDYINAQRLRRGMQREFSKLWGKVDCLFTPTAPTGAPKIGAATVKIGEVVEDTRIASTRLVRAINLLGVPAISVPAGSTGEGLPIGLQIVGQSFGERELLLFAAAIHP